MRWQIQRSSRFCTSGVLKCDRSVVIYQLSFCGAGRNCKLHECFILMKRFDASEDPQINMFLKEMQSNPREAQKQMMSDPKLMEAVNKLVAAGIIRTG